MPRLLLYFLFFVPFVACAQPTTDGFHTVTKVVDGDTFYINDGTSKGAKIRLIGVDSPETKHPKYGVQPFGPEASAFLTELLDGQHVRLEFDVQERDRYGRLLAYVYLEDGTFVNALLVEKGFATVATFPPNVKYVEVFTRLQTEAREGKRGMWGK